MSVLATDVPTSTAADVVVIPPSMTEESFEDIIAKQQGGGLKNEDEMWATPPTSPAADVTARYTLSGLPVPSKGEHCPPVVDDISHELGQADIGKDNIEVMIVPSAITGRPKPRVWDSWPSLGNPWPVTLQSIERPPRRKSNAGQWLSSKGAEPGVVGFEQDHASSSSEVTDDEGKR